jgi:hypothetical protein
MRLLPTSLFALASLATFACAAPADETTQGGSDAVTGVTDLSALEAELGFVKDTQSAAGAWSRPDAKLTAGSCYKSTIGSADGASYEFRRYTKGAAFFTKLGATAESGNKRPIACVDVDADYDDNGKPIVLSLNGLSLDLTMRLHLGKPTGWDAGLGHLYVDYERAMAEVGDSDHYCGIMGDSGTKSPGSDAYAQAITACKQQAGSEDVCGEKAMTACEKAVAKDIVADTIDRPAFPSTDDGVPGGVYFYSLQLDPGNKTGNQAYVNAGLLSAVYRYALRVAANRNAFTLTGDPVGKFVSFDQTNSNDMTTVSEHARFEKLDAHHLVSDGIERLAITPKGSDAKVVESAVVLCTRAVGGEYNQPTAAYQCRGL